MDAAGESERLEAGVGVAYHPAPDIVVHLLHDLAAVDVDHGADAAQVVADHPVAAGVLEDDAGHVGVFGVEVDAVYPPVRAQPGDGVELVPV